MAKVYLDPITRIEGHLSLELDVQGGKVVDAKSKGDMFRGFERILRGRNPLDANQITQRICGVCPVSHGIASSKCLDDAFDKKPNKNGRILRNLILGANYLQSHIIHFYHLAALDFVDITALLEYKGNVAALKNLKAWAKSELADKDNPAPVSPFLPRYEGKDFYIKDQAINESAITGYVQALDMRIKAHKMAALFGGRMPHAIGLVPGGVTQVPTKDKIKEYGKLLEEVEEFVTNTYYAHIIEVAKAFPAYFKLGSYDKLLSYGVFDLQDDKDEFLFQRGFAVGTNPGKFDHNKITEHVKYSRFSSPSQLYPLEGQTDPNPNKGGAYTWLKAPRYDGMPMEVGPLPRIAVSYLSKNKAVQTEVDALLRKLGKDPKKDLGLVFSTLGRHASRVIECKMICNDAKKWLEELEVGGKPRSTFTIPESGEGMGLTEAPRGALGHWIDIKDQKIANYQCVVPTTWFCGPRDDKGVKGPVEQSLIGTPISDPKNPIEAARIVRSFDPCIACAVHVMEGDKEIGKFRVC